MIPLSELNDINTDVITPFENTKNSKGQLFVVLAVTSLLVALSLYSINNTKILDEDEYVS